MFIYYYNINFLAEAFKRQNGDDDGENGKDSGDGASNGKATSRKNGTDEGRNQGYATGGAASAKGDESSDDSSTTEVVGNFGRALIRNVRGGCWGFGTVNGGFGGGFRVGFFMS